MELIDGYNENNEPTGDIVERFEAFDKGLWKRVVSCWILNENGEILMQKRAPNKKRNPNKWAKTGGQVDKRRNTRSSYKERSKRRAWNWY